VLIVRQKRHAGIGGMAEGRAASQDGRAAACQRGIVDDSTSVVSLQDWKWHLMVRITGVVLGFIAAPLIAVP
jgi:hypothetical protein